MIDFDSDANIDMIKRVFKAPACITSVMYNLGINRCVEVKHALEELKMQLNNQSDTLAIA